MEISAIKGRSKAMEEGRWIGKIPGFPGVRLLVRSSTSPTIRNAVAKALRDIPRAEMLGGVISEEAAAEIDADVFSRLGLLGWEGITADGVPVPFSAEAAHDLISGAWQFRDAVALAMRRVAVDYDGKTEEIAGN